MEMRQERMDLGSRKTLRIASLVWLGLVAAGCKRTADVSTADLPSKQASQPRYYCDGSGDLVESGNPQPVAKRLFFVSSVDGQGTDYAIQDGETSVKILRCAADGSLISTLQTTDDKIRNLAHLDTLVVLPNGHLFLDGEINPSVGLGIDLNGSTNEHRLFLGYGFTWDRQGKSVAYFRDPPDAPPEISGEIWVNGTALRQIPQHSGKSMTWVADGHTLDIVLKNGSTDSIDIQSAAPIMSQIDN